MRILLAEDECKLASAIVAFLKDEGMMSIMLEMDLLHYHL